MYNFQIASIQADSRIVNQGQGASLWGRTDFMDMANLDSGDHIYFLDDIFPSKCSNTYK